MRHTPWLRLQQNRNPPPIQRAPPRCPKRQTAAEPSRSAPGTPPDPDDLHRSIEQALPFAGLRPLFSPEEGSMIPESALQPPATGEARPSPSAVGRHT